MVNVQERPDVKALCPHCAMELEAIWMQQIKSFLGKRYVYFCSHCRKTLGVSHRKGFWMG